MRIRKKKSKIVGSFAMTAVHMLLVLGLILGFFPNLAAVRTEGLNNQLPVAMAISESKQYFPGEFVIFDGSDSYDPDGFIVSYEWNFGDGISDTGVSVLHGYKDPGTYNVTLIVTDNDCGIDIIIIIIIIIDPGTPPPCVNLPPVAVPEPRYQEIVIGNEAIFDGSASYDPDGFIVSHEWDFGDGHTASGVSVTHNYNAPGRYMATLTVTDDDGAYGFDHCAVVVHDDCPPPPNVNLPPIPVPEPRYQEVMVGEEALFDGSWSYDQDGFIVSYEWDFGDNSSAIGVYVNHTYTAQGDYMVMLTVTDDDGASSSDYCVVRVFDDCPPPGVNLPPVAVPEPKYQEIMVGDEANFDGSASYDVDGYIVSYEWDFGDGYTASGASVTHIYNAPGRYMVTLTVTDDDGATGFDYSAVVVHDDCPPPPNVNLPPVAVPEPKYQEIMVGDEAIFDGSWSYDPDGFIVSYEWDFGDGSNASGVTTSHIYDTYGEYIVTLTVTDDDGTSSFDFCIVIVLEEAPPPCPNIPPVAVAQPKCQEIALNETAAFDGSASYDIDGVIVSYEWDFGDGTTGSEPRVTHQYEIPGCYTVFLIVMDDDNATSLDMCYVHVLENKEPWPEENIPPTAVAQPKSQEIYTGEFAQLDGFESFDEDGYIVAYIWTPFWGTVFTGQMVSIPFENPGTYTVMLMVEDDLGAVGTDTVTVEVVDPQPSFKPDPDENGGDIKIDRPDIVDHLTDDEEPMLILTAGLINIATFREGVQRSVPVEVTSYHGDVHMVHIELIDDGGLDIEVIPISKNVREGRIARFYLRITVPDLPDDTPSMGITLQLKAVGLETESNVEHIDILISEEGSAEEYNNTQTATTMGTVSAAGILGLLAKRRFL